MLFVWNLHNVSNAEKYLGFTSDILKKIAQTNLDMEEEKLKASMHFLKNPQQPVQVAYTGPDGQVVGPIAAMPIQTEFGIQYTTPSLQLTKEDMVERLKGYLADELRVASKFNGKIF